MAPFNGLDQGALLRTQKHLETLIENIPNAQSLWKDYGIVSDLKVSIKVPLYIHSFDL